MLLHAVDSYELRLQLIGKLSGAPRHWRIGRDSREKSGRERAALRLARGLPPLPLCGRRVRTGEPPARMSVDVE